MVDTEGYDKFIMSIKSLLSKIIVEFHEIVETTVSAVRDLKGISKVIVKRVKSKIAKNIFKLLGDFLTLLSIFRAQFDLPKAIIALPVLLNNSIEPRAPSSL